MRWQIQQAKQRFSELVDQAREKGPQVVTRHGEEVAIVMSIDEYRRLKGGGRDFKAFLRKGPYVDLDDVDFGRQRDLPRDVDL
ncbi:MAG: type II toxin-antitoxin system Phd/YefM family antitoxin [Myxococcaceae bacterium]